MPSDAAARIADTHSQKVPCIVDLFSKYTRALTLRIFLFTGMFVKHMWEAAAVVRGGPIGPKHEYAKVRTLYGGFI